MLPSKSSRHPASAFIRSKPLLVLLVFLISTALASCEADFDPFEPGPLSFGVYGYLDTAADTQFVRIIPMRRLLERDGKGFLGNLTITNIGTSESFVARDSVVKLEDGTEALAYWVTLTPKPLESYRLDVIRDDGLTVTAQTRVPELISGDSIYIFPVRFDGRLYYPLYLLSLDKPPFDLRFVYEVSEAPNGPRSHIPIRYLGELSGRKVDRPNTWYLEVDLVTDGKNVRSEWADNHGRMPTRLYLHSITMLSASVSDEWIPPGGVFDPEILIMPGAYGNIEGGEGFFGSVARYKLTWVLTDETYLNYAGFAYLGSNWAYEHPNF